MTKRPGGPLSRDDSLSGAFEGTDKRKSDEDALAPEDEAFLDRLARWIATRGMSVPAVLFLESSKPLNFVGSQFLFFFEPMVKIFVGGEGYTRFARLMERRETVEEFLVKIEAADEAVRDERKSREDA